jgi:hypothetical protein
MAAAPVSARRDRGLRLAGWCIVLLAMGAAAFVWWMLRPNRAHHARELRNSVVELGAGTTQAFSFTLERAGLLQIELSVPTGQGLTAYLMTRGPHSATRPNEARLIAEFTAHDAAEYRRQAALGPGEYQLWLLNPAPLGAGGMRLHLQARTAPHSFLPES